MFQKIDDKHSYFMLHNMVLGSIRYANNGNNYTIIKHKCLKK